jgi:peptidoglycan/LPS O-acetylase OafA/YrhL
MGTSALAILKRRSFAKRDEFAGSLSSICRQSQLQFVGSHSYGVFLSHFIFIMVFQSIFNQDHFGPWLSIKPVP